ncbi:MULTISPECIES: hypothetical protein [Anoxybacillus]|uniref:Uncharacterized protein n=2 Tax=Anoxybacillus TaxID=150247 RepID=A0A1I0SWF2_9BACL|nr:MULTISPECIES: hypothetical protein [Anoxybacillus]EMT46236.1 hypothetical protein H919_06556 [Anoxybacillus flavithermus AK1]MBW7651130.1 hypothetical protein [Anoxybacillus sp. ST4]SFA43834.1 hypothetical protein SAMN05216169_100845 [Anoxybacillus pushchinoensis]
MRFPIAQLHERDIAQVQQWEQTLRQQTGEDIILIAYKGVERDEKKSDT